MFKKLQRGFTLIELMIVVAIIGILAAIAIPNFIKFQARSKQTEAKANLKAIFTAQKAYIQEKDKYSSEMNEIGFAPERGNRYAYFLNADGDCQDRTAADLNSQTAHECIEVDTFKHSAETAKPECDGTVREAAVSTARPFTFVANAVGNIDNDLAMDCWSIASESVSDPANIVAGEPYNDQDDVSVEEAGGDDGADDDDDDGGP